MKYDVLDEIFCPFCKESLVLEAIYHEIEGNIIHGYVSCGCEKYPIIEEILYLQKNPLNERVINNMKNGKYNESILTLIRKKALIKKDKLKIFLSKVPYFNIDYVKNIDKKRFYDIMAKSHFGEYCKHRFSSETFWSIYPTIYMMKKMSKTKNILDLACGMGHTSYTINKYLKPKTFYCVDISILHLLLLKKFFVNNASCICLDLNYGLPFKDDYFDSIHFMDAFHYVSDKISLSNDIENILIEDGLLFLNHLHNIMYENKGQGYALRPKDWLGLFHKLRVKGVPEGKMIRDFLYKDMLDLKKTFDVGYLNKFNSINLIGGSQIDIEKIYNGIWSYILEKKNELIINPIYNVTEENNKVVLNRNLPDEFYRDKYHISIDYLPEKYEVTEELSNKIKNRRISLNQLKNSDLTGIENMMKKFILINAPLKYI
jgi:SAM-dependent methyltransferase/uncharacterized protein YbaR (Trm112 family)